jgi:hypothetical protein
MQESEKFFRGEYDLHIYKNNKELSQLLQQAEIDCVGVQINDGKCVSCTAVEIAYHSNGINYGSRTETVERILKKLLRSAMCMSGYFGIHDGEIVFAAPKINRAILQDLEQPIADTQVLLQEDGFSFQIKVICNEDFETEILKPTTNIAAQVSDTTELFLRSHQLESLFYHEASNRVSSQYDTRQTTNAVPVTQNEVISNQEKHLSKETLPIKLYPADQELFKSELLRTRNASVEIHYSDGKKDIKRWPANNFKESSDLMQNIRSKSYLRQWQKRGIAKVICRIIQE